MSIEEFRMWLSIAASMTTLLAFLGIGFAPVRKVVKKWMGDLFTYDVRLDMNAGFARLEDKISALVKESTKERLLGNKRHASNIKKLKTIEVGLTIANHRLDEHEVDAAAHRKATEGT